MPAGPSVSRRQAWFALVGLALAPLVYFWRGTLGEVLLAPVDGVLYSFPSRLLAAQIAAGGALPLWNPYVFSGFPLFAEMQTAVLYPGAWLFYLLPPVAAMNAQMLLTYSIAALGTYAYTRAIGCTPFGAAFAGLTFAFGGFMPAHLGHVATPQGAACLPWFLWSLERLRHVARLRLVIAGAVALAVSIAAGHPPIPLYLLLVGGLYVAWFALLGRPPLGRAGVLALSAAVVVVGLALAAVQLIPAAELAGQSVRAELSYADFVSFSLPRAQLPMLLFPYFFGITPPVPYWGEWNLAELTGYVGAAPLMLAAAALPLLRRDRHVAFWVCLAAFALLLALGDAGLGPLMYRVPVYQLFRAQARNLMSFDFAVAVLAALSLRAATPRALRRGAALVVVVGALFAVVAHLFGEAIWAPHAVRRVGDVGRALVAAATAASSPALLVPLACIATAAVAVVGLAQRPSGVRRALLLAVQALDLFVFNALMRQPLPHAADVLTPPEQVRALQALQAGAPAARAALLEARPAATDYRYGLWGIELVNGYDPFMLSRYGELARMPYWGELSAAGLAQRPFFLDLLNARYLLLRKPAPELRWPRLRAALYSGQAMEVVPPSPRQTSALEVVTNLANAVVEPGAAVARLTLWDANGTSEALLLRAGVHTGASDRAAVSHSGSEAIDARAVGAPGTRAYRAVLPVRPAAVTRVRIESLLGGGLLTVAGAALIDDRLGQRDAFTPLDVLRAEPTRWALRGETDTYALLENRHALPRAWLVDRTRVLAAADVLAAVRDGRLPDGERFDPAREALIEEGSTRDRGGLDPAAQVTLVAAAPNTLELTSQSASAAFLVVSEIAYPGWRAFVDGVEAPIVRTDYVLRGLELPPGAHHIRFVFDPISLRRGAAISLATLALLLAAALWRAWPRLVVRPSAQHVARDVLRNRPAAQP